MTLAVWKGGQVIANVVGGISPFPTAELPEQRRCVLDRLIAADDHYEIYSADGIRKHMHVEGISCWPQGNEIVFIFIETGYV